MKAYCFYCDIEFKKPNWEHLINYIYKLGGHAGKNKCPQCKYDNMLEFDYTDESIED